jgi:hypothetical protein
MCVAAVPALVESRLLLSNGLHRPRKINSKGNVWNIVNFGSVLIELIVLSAFKSPLG